MNLKERIEAFVAASHEVREKLHSFYNDDTGEFMNMLRRVSESNPWFTIENQKMALQAIAGLLDENKLQDWISHYPGLADENRSPKNIGVIMAGNIPMVGFHDLLCVLISGHRLVAKCSKDDLVLIPWFCNLLVRVNPYFGTLIHLTERIKDIDAVIATGSDNSAGYFEYYFGKYPHIIRKNRNAVGILTGNETMEEMEMLGTDIFSYFGLGCRNVSKMYVPRGYDFKNFFRAMEKFSGLLQHNKYMSNHDYYSAILLMKKIPFLTNNFLILLEDKNYSTPVSVLHFEYYNNFDELLQQLDHDRDRIQCLVAKEALFPAFLPFGMSQFPGLMDYADGVDTMRFLESLR